MPIKPRHLYLIKSDVPVAAPMATDKAVLDRPLIKFLTLLADSIDAQVDSITNSF
jgi:hypothetical protein